MTNLSIPLRIFCGIVLLVSLTGDLFAQQEQIRRDLRTPGLVVENGAPTSRCWSLQFTVNETELLAAGLDKTIREWSIKDRQLDHSASKIYRWAAYREQRGTIFCTALSHEPGQRFLAVAGWGLRNGSIAVIDRQNGEVVFGLKDRLGLQSIYSVTFSPDNDKIIYGSFDGNVGVWDFRNNTVEVLGRHGSATANPVWCIRPLNQETYLSVAEDGSILRWNIRTKKSEHSASFNGEVNYAYISDDASTIAVSGFLTSEKQLAVAVYSTASPNPTGRRIEIPSEFRPRTVVLTSTGKTLAVVGEQAQSSSILFYDTETGQALPETRPKTNGRIDTLVFSSSEKSLAWAGGEKDAVVLWDRPTQRQIGIVQSSGRLPIKVAFNKNADRGEMLGFETNGKPGTWIVFDLKSRAWISEPEKNFQPVLPTETLGDWRIVSDTADTRIWYAQHQQTGERQRIPTIPEIDFEPTCFSFIPKEPGETGVRLVVGHTWGASLFRILPKTPPELLRRFVGHQGEVRALGISEDKRRLVTAGRDQTIAVWSLDPWQNQRELGVDFTIRRNTMLTVTNVASGSPGWEAKLQPGDEIVRFFYDAQEIQGSPNTWQQILKSPVPGKELVFYARRPGQAEQIVTLTTVRQRPLWRFFSTDGGEWILWRWRDYYYDCSTKGDDLIGWQINTEVDQTPRFITAEQFRSRFHRPDKITEILRQTEIGKAIAPERIDDVDLRPPKLSLQCANIRSGCFRVSIRASSKADSLQAPPDEVCLWLNDYKIRRWSQTPADFADDIVIDARQLRQGKNLLVAQAYTENGLRGDSQIISITKASVNVKPKLFAICIGVNDYSGAVNIPSLEFCREDSDAIRDILNVQSEVASFSQGKIFSFNDKNATRENIISALKSVAEEAESDDLCVLFMAGHGWAKNLPGHEGEFDPKTFTFLTPAFDLNQPESTGINFLNWSHTLGNESLYDLLVQIPCHKAVLLDCCHSGSIMGSETDLIRCLIPERLGPVILVACNRNEEAHPYPAKQHGIFTVAVLEAFHESFRRADTDRNGKLSCEELADWVTDRVPMLAEEVHSKYETERGTRTSRFRSQHAQAFLPQIRPVHLLFGKPKQ